MNVEECPKCHRPCLPVASEDMRRMGTVCTCASTMPRQAAKMPVQKAQEPKGNKYGARKVEIGGITFDSQKEARRYQELRLMEKAGEITDLELQPYYQFVVNGVMIGSYTADFRYRQGGKLIVEDCKSEATRRIRDYPLRKKLLLACYGIHLTEV